MRGAVLGPWPRGSPFPGHGLQWRVPVRAESSVRLQASELQILFPIQPPPLLPQESYLRAATAWGWWGSGGGEVVAWPGSCRWGVSCGASRGLVSPCTTPVTGVADVADGGRGRAGLSHRGCGQRGGIRPAWRAVIHRLWMNMCVNHRRVIHSGFGGASAALGASRRRGHCARGGGAGAHGCCAWRESARPGWPVRCRRDALIRPARAGTRPARAGTRPARGGTVPARGGTVPARGGTVPARGGTVPARAGTASRATVATASVRRGAVRDPAWLSRRSCGWPWRAARWWADRSACGAPGAKPQVTVWAGCLPGGGGGVNNAFYPTAMGGDLPLPGAVGGAQGGPAGGAMRVAEVL